MGKEKKTVAKSEKGITKSVAKGRTSATKDKSSVATRDVYLENHEGSSNKFYRLKLEGTSVTSTFGRVGTAGQNSVKEFATVDKVWSVGRRPSTTNLLENCGAVRRNNS